MAAAALAATPRYRRARVSLDSCDPVRLACAVVNAVAPPLARVDWAVLAGPGGSARAATATNGRRTRAPCAGESASACSSIGGVRGARWAPAAARAADVEWLRWRRDLSLPPRQATGARLQPWVATGGSEAAPGGPSPARWWSRVMLGPASAPGAHVRSCSDHVHECICLCVQYEKSRDISRLYLRYVVMTMSYAHAGMQVEASGVCGELWSVIGALLGTLVFWPPSPNRVFHTSLA